MLESHFTLVETSIDRMLEEARGMFVAHFVEAGLGTAMEFDLDVELLQGLVDQDLMIIVSVSDEGDVMRGYCIALIAPDLLRRGRLLAQHLALYVQPEFRDHGLDVMLMEHVEELARDKFDANAVIWGAQKGSAFESILDHRVDTHAREIQYFKEL